MGASRTLLRKLDLDLIERIEASGKPEKKQTKTSRGGKPRDGFTYRGARRNAVRTRGMDLMLRHAPEAVETIAPAAYLNRSDKWPRYMNYRIAREMGPSSEPVR